MEEYTIECLRRLPLFCGLDAASLVNLADCLERRHFEKEHVLFRQGDPGDVLYII